MKKRKILLGVLLIYFVVMISCVFAAENDTGPSKISDAYTCLETKVGDCSDLSTEEKIFSLLALRKCQTELIDDSNNECFPSSGCKVKTTAQAILALEKTSYDTTEMEEWLVKQNKTPTDVVWYLQIDSPEDTICTISYGSNEYSFYINENKKINQGGGCFSLAQDGYWLEIASSCYDYEFEISCDEQFITSLLFKKKDSSKIFISENTQSASAEGVLKEKVNSFCFTQGGSCNYESSLWATLVLDYLGYEIESFMPYLITMAEENSQYIPEAFLYMLTDDTDYRIDLLELQISNYWDESGDKFYDTAVALYPFQYEDPTEKTKAEEWLLETQDNQGCWKGNIRNTAFLLYSIWPKDFDYDDEEVIEETEDCEDDIGGFCMTSVTCEEAGGEELSAYSSTCSGINICCNKEEILETCEELNGEECPSNEECSTSTINAADTSECCLGYCKEVVEKPDCEKYGGICKSSCNSDEEETVDECDSGDICCIEKDEPEKSYWWIWLLLILIVLVLLGIIFRDKLRPYWFRITSKFKKSKPKPSRPRRGFPSPYMMPTRRIVPRRQTPTQSKVPQRTPPKQEAPKKKQPTELDDVLKKLKEIGK